MAGTTDFHTRATRRAIAYWTTTALVVTESGVGGTLDVLRQPPFFSIMTDLGYPPYLATILGTAKLLAVPALLVPGLPRLREWAYAGIVFNMLGAAASHLAVGDDPATLVAPLAFACLAFASRALRPNDRAVPH